VAGPALESLRYVGHKESLSELYANLLASSMDAETAKNAHPGFVEIIRNLSADEAKVLTFLYKHRVAAVIDVRRQLKKDQSGITLHELIGTIGFDAGCEHRDLIPSYLTNLERLGLVAMDKGRFLSAPDAYNRILEDAPVKTLIEQLNAEPEHQAEIVKYFVQLTPLGRQFGNACIASKNGT
jgi:hypothetical protein